MKLALSQHLGIQITKEGKEEEKKYKSQTILRKQIKCQTFLTSQNCDLWSKKQESNDWLSWNISFLYTLFPDFKKSVLETMKTKNNFMVFCFHFFLYKLQENGKQSEKRTCKIKNVFSNQISEDSKKWNCDKREKIKTWSLNVFPFGFWRVFGVVNPDAQHTQNDCTKWSAGNSNSNYHFLVRIHVLLFSPHHNSWSICSIWQWASKYVLFIQISNHLWQGNRV